MTRPPMPIPDPVGLQRKTAMPRCLSTLREMESQQGEGNITRGVKRRYGAERHSLFGKSQSRIPPVPTFRAWRVLGVLVRESLGSSSRPGTRSHRNLQARAHCLQCLLEIGNQVVAIFDSNREPHHLFGHAHLRALFAGDHCVRRQHRN